MNKQRKILTFLTNLAVAICLFFFFFLWAIGHHTNLWVFIYAGGVFAANNWLIQKRQYTSAFVIFSLTTNFLLLIFDTGYKSPVNSYVFYFPLLLANFLLTRPHQRKERILVMSFTFLCFFLTNFTSFTPQLGNLLYEPAFVRVASAVNICVSLLCSMVALYIINDLNHAEERKIIETGNKIREAEERWNYALSNNHEGVWDYNMVTGYVYYSPQWKRMLGYSEKDIQSSLEAWKGLLHPEDISSASRVMDRHFNGESSFYEHVHRMLCKDGSYKWIYSKGKICEVDTNGRPLRFIGTHSDITEQKMAQSALIKSQQLLNSINQNIDVAICRTSKEENKLLYVNRSYLDLFGFRDNVSALHEDPGSIYFHKQDRDKILYMLEQQGSLSNLEVKYKRKDGTTFWGLLSSTRTVDEEGKIYYDGALRDITFLKEIEAELITARDQAEKASVAKSQFLSTMSHEIRTPMNAVIGISNLLIQDDPKPEQIENLNVLKFSAENLLTLINNILDFSKIEAGKIELEEIQVNIHQLLSAIIQSHVIEAEQKGLELYFDSNIDGIFLTDPTRLSQILNNLIANAIKFTEKGSVHIRVDQIAENKEYTSLKFSVRDTGIGIDKDKVTYIFDRFNQENVDISRRFGGTGLGLSITKLLLELMSSNIEVETEKGKGTTFSFVLALKRVSASAVKHIEEEERDLKKMPILLVDDNPMNILLLNKFLIRWNATIDIAHNGAEAIEKVRNNNYNLVLMDLHMPEMDGYAATSEIRVFDKQVPIFALTADAFADTRLRALESGMNDFISKPFNPDELYNKIASLYSNSSNS